MVFKINALRHGVDMKRYHVIGIAALVGFIFGVAAPAKAEISDSFILKCANGSRALNYSVSNPKGAHAVVTDFQHFISYRGDLFTFAGVITSSETNYVSTVDPDYSLVVVFDNGVTTYNVLKKGEIVSSAVCMA
ncbi:hypothetical protein RWE39_004380 [Salmonella enterica]|nr:hypothetical protein [Salmonella enterica]